MEYLKEILTIIISSLIGASSSAIITILSGRREYSFFGKLFYSIKFHLVLIIYLIISLIFIYLIIYIYKNING